MLKQLRSFQKSEDGVAAIELAIVAPVLVFLLLGLLEYSYYVQVQRRATLATEFAADYISRDNDGILTAEERQTVEDIWLVVNPLAYIVAQKRGASPTTGYSNAFASVSFTPVDLDCTKHGCDFEPEVQWSYLKDSIISEPVQMECDVTVVANDADRNGSEIPEGMTGRGPIVVVDYVYPYQPFISDVYLSSQEIHINSIRKTRDGFTLQSENAESITRC